MQMLSNLVFIAASVATLGLLLAGGVEIYAYLWNKVSELRKGKK